MIQELGVVTPVYSVGENNRLEDYFRDTAGSVLGQDYDFCWVIVDDGSEHDVGGYVRSLRDSRTVFLKRERQAGDRETSSNAVNLGLNYLFEKGCKSFAYIHSDDLLCQKSLELRVEALQRHDLVYGRMGLLLDGQLFPRDYPPKNIDPTSLELLSGGFTHHTSMWSRKMMNYMIKKRKGRVFNPIWNCAEDLDVTLLSRRLLMDNPELSLGFVDKFLYVWRRSKGNITEKIDKQLEREETGKIYEEHGFESPYSRMKLYLRSPFRFLPESVKAPFRWTRPIFRKLSGGLLYPDSSFQLEEIDPFWFKSSQ